MYFQIEIATSDEVIDDPVVVIRKIIGDRTWSQPLVENEGLHAEMLTWEAEGNTPEVIDG